MRIIILILFCLSIFSLAGCEHKEALENAKITVDGKQYEIKITEVRPPDNNENSINSEAGTVSPPSTKYQVVTPNEVYCTNTVLYKYPDVVTIVNYSVRENGVWVFHEETLDLSRKDGDIKVEQFKM